MPAQKADAIQRWLAALRDPKTTCDIPLGGHTTVARDWTTGQRTLSRDHALYLPTRFSIGGQVGGHFLTAEPGSLLWIPPGLPHHLRPANPGQPFEVWWLRLRITQGRRPVPGPRAIVEENAWDAIPLLRQLVGEMHPSGVDSWRDERVRALLVLLGARAGAVGEEGLSPPQRRAVERLGADSVSKRLRAADLAAAANLSPDYFARLFTRTFGQSPRAWLVKHRINAAAMRLADSALSVKQIARQLGYDETFLFSRQFKQVTGQSPTAYRASMR